MKTSGKWWAIALPILLSIPSEGGANPTTDSEYELKAAFLYNFAKFVDWPEHSFSESRDALTIGLLGNDPFGEILDDTVRGKSINGRKFRIKRLKSHDQIKDCHVLYVGHSTERTTVDIISYLEGLNVLSVSDIEDFAEQGGIINFIFVQNRIGFVINEEAARVAGLKISSKLLQVASVVVTRNRRGQLRMVKRRPNGH